MAAIAALVAALGVVAGAFGAHGLKALVPPEALAWWQTGAHYHLVHAVALLVAALLTPARPRARRVATILLLVGIALFSGTLYLMALTDLRWLGAITPIGGSAFIAGWVALAWSLWPPRRPG